MPDNKEPNLRHLAWLIDSRGKNNATSLKLLSLFESYPSKIYREPHSPRAQNLVAVAFSLWRAAFLTDTEGKIEQKAGHAENFLRKMLTDNAISFAQDIQWREWSVNYYISDARARLVQMSDTWPALKKGGFKVPKGQRTSKGRWTLLHKAFKSAVNHLEKDLAG